MSNILIKRFVAGGQEIPMNLDTATGRFNCIFLADGETKQATSLSLLDCERVVQEALADSDTASVEAERLSRLRNYEAQVVRLTTNLVTVENLVRAHLKEMSEVLPALDNYNRVDALRKTADDLKDYIDAREKVDAEMREQLQAGKSEVAEAVEREPSPDGA